GIRGILSHQLTTQPMDLPRLNPTYISFYSSAIAVIAIAPSFVTAGLRLLRHPVLSVIQSHYRRRAVRVNRQISGIVVSHRAAITTGHTETVVRSGYCEVGFRNSGSVGF